MANLLASKGFRPDDYELQENVGEGLFSAEGGRRLLRVYFE